jgi:hypothetical protein
VFPTGAPHNENRRAGLLPRRAPNEKRTTVVMGQPATSATGRLRPHLRDAALHGLAGDVARELSRATGTDPAANLLHFLTMIGNGAGPQPHLRVGGADHPARLHALVVGDAASGLKGTSLASVEDLFAEADPHWHTHRIRRSGLQSPEAMIELVADGPGGDCRLMIVETEYARFVARSAASGTFLPILRNAFDGTPLQLDRVRRGAP